MRADGGLLNSFQKKLFHYHSRGIWEYWLKDRSTVNFSLSHSIHPIIVSQALLAEFFKININDIKYVSCDLFKRRVGLLHQSRKCFGDDESRFPQNRHRHTFCFGIWKTYIECIIFTFKLLTHNVFIQLWCKQLNTTQLKKITIYRLAFY